LPRTISPRVKKLRVKREKVVREIKGLDRDIDFLERELGLGSSRRRRAASVATTTRRPNARRVNDVTVKDAIVKLLRQKKRPLHYRDIANTLLREGRYKTKSKNFVSTVAITIIRDKRLKRVGSGIYALRKNA
jgi:hypothetical protein